MTSLGGVRRVALVIVGVFTFGGSYALYWLVDRLIPMRVGSTSDR